MKKQHIIFAGTFLLSSLIISPVNSATPDNDPELTSIQTEINRNMKGLQINKMASPCFIDFRMTDGSYLNIKANRGTLIYSNEHQYRNGIPTVLVGDYTTTNQHFISTARDLYNTNTYPVGVAFGTNDAVIRTAIWKILDEKYKTAAELHSNKVNQLKQIELPEEERSIPDFQRMEAFTQILPAQPLKYDRKNVEDYIMKASKVFEAYRELNASDINLYAASADVRYANSEGTICRSPSNLIIITIYTRSQSKEGEEITQHKSLAFDSFDDIPSLTDLESICREQAELMQKKLAASMIKESYVGPVLFEEEAVADLMDLYMVTNNAILAKRKLLATSEVRQYYSNNPKLSSNELESMFNKKVMSRDLTLTSLTGTPEYKGQKLFGHYEVDAQGVKPDKELVLIEDGVLRNMLTTRTPTLLFRQSNGHARAAIHGSDISLRPGVLRLSSKTTVSAAEMKKKLIAAAKEEDYEYAYIVRKLNGDTPSELIRLNIKDGSEELIRGAIIKGMSLRLFKRISAVSNKENIYNRVYNNIKSSNIVPSSLLFEEVDIVKDPKLTLKKSYVIEKP